MIKVKNKDLIDLKLGSKQVLKVYKGKELEWELKSYYVHLTGSFADTPQEQRYVWINGVKYYLDMDFDLSLYLKEPWTFGEAPYVLGSTNNTSSWFGSGLKTITDIKGTDYIEYPTCMFIDQSSLVDISGLSKWDTSNVKSLMAIFRGCSSLSDITPLERWNVSNVDNLSSAFQNCVSLEDISAIYTWNPVLNTGLNNFFNGCTSLSEVDLSNWHAPVLNRCSSLIAGCSKVTKLNVSNLITSQNTRINSMVTNCGSLKELNLSNCNFSSVSDNSVFTNCTSLTTLVGPFYNWKSQYSEIQNCPLSVESCVTLFEGLVNDGTKRTLTIKSSSYSQLSSEQIAIATAKGWSIAKG